MMVIHIEGTMKSIKNLTHGFAISQSPSPERREKAIDETMELIDQTSKALQPLLKIDLATATIEDIKSASDRLQKQIAAFKIMAFQEDGWIFSTITTVDSSGSSYTKNLLLPADVETVERETNRWIEENAEGPTFSRLNRVSEMLEDVYPVDLAIAKMQSIHAGFSWSQTGGQYHPGSLRVTISDQVLLPSHGLITLRDHCSMGLRRIATKDLGLLFGEKSAIEISSMLSQCSDVVRECQDLFSSEPSEFVTITMHPLEAKLEVRRHEGGIQEIELKEAKRFEPASNFPPPLALPAKTRRTSGPNV